MLRVKDHFYGRKGFYLARCTASRDNGYFLLEIDKFLDKARGVERLCQVIGRSHDLYTSAIVSLATKLVYKRKEVGMSLNLGRGLREIKFGSRDTVVAVKSLLQTLVLDESNYVGFRVYSLTLPLKSA